jgi:hypothetical protein
MLISTKWISFVLAVTLSFSLSAKENNQEKNKKEMIHNLDVIKHAFDTKYAPTEWKKEFANWDLEEQIEKAQLQIKKSDPISLKQYQSLVKGFFKSTQDQHVGVFFHSTASALLPFQIRSAEGRYFVTWSDSKYFDESLQVNDEIIAINDVAVQEVFKCFKEQEYFQKDCLTENALAEMYFTMRVGVLGHEMPDPFTPITFTVKRPEHDSLIDVEFLWSIKDEEISDGPFSLKPKQPSSRIAKSAPLKNHEFFKKCMLPAFYLPLRSVIKAEDSNLGSIEGPIPNLGELIWESDVSSPFRAYIYKNELDQKIGFVRIPSYHSEELEAQKFSEIITYLEKHSDALVIDQTNNPGGYVFYLYAIASMLSPEPLVVPSHRMTLTQEDVVAAKELLKVLKNGSAAFEGETSIQGYPVSENFVLQLVKYNHQIVSEWNKGHKFTDSVYLYGIDMITPNPKGCYSKPILMLINELDFSCADFLPAILQDNRRAVMMGTKTAGAGGLLTSMSYPNRLGISGLSMTGSIARRIDNKPIENLGVTPDIVYEVTAKDLTDGYVDYIKAINKAVSNLLK